MKQDQTNNTRLLQEIRPVNLLSFSQSTRGLPLESLNVLIGPNGAGKSNLIEAVDLLRSTATDVRKVVEKGGGVGEWIWKGAQDSPARLEATLSFPRTSRPIRHEISFVNIREKFRLHQERIETDRNHPDQSLPGGSYSANYDLATLHSTRGKSRLASRSQIDPNTSILTQLRDPEVYFELHYLTEVYSKIRIYRDWTFGRNTLFRSPQPTDMRSDFLAEDFSNLGLFLSRIRLNAKAKRLLLEALRDLYEGLTDFEISTKGGTVEVFLAEGDYMIPATRLSDGTLRYLCLLAVLCDPEPPPLICIEEPELGLHPDILPKLADLLIAASGRTQLIVTTHSDILVDAMTEHPESVVVCEKHGGQTEMYRLKRAELKAWLGKYRLGQLWIDGQLGGKRW